MFELAIDLSSDELAAIEARAAKKGYASPSAYAKDVVMRALARNPPPPAGQMVDRQPPASETGGNGHSND